MDNILPLDLKEGDTVLLCSLYYKPQCEDRFKFVEEELNRRGIKTVHLKKPSHRDIEKVYDENNVSAVLVNCGVAQIDSIGGSLRLGWDEIFAFWRGYIFRHPKVVFTSFADPYKLYEIPFMRTYVNTFSFTEESQKALVKVLLGEIEAQGKNPVALKGFFEREV